MTRTVEEVRAFLTAALERGKDAKAHPNPTWTPSQRLYADGIADGMEQSCLQTLAFIDGRPTGDVLTEGEPDAEHR